MKNKWVTGSVIAMCVLGVIYGAGVFYYKDKFLRGTSINGILCENMNVKEAEQKIKEQVEEYQLEMQFKDGVKEVLKGSDMDYRYISDDGIADLQKQQNPFTWVSGFFGNEKKYSLKTRFQFNEEKLKDKIQGFGVMQESNMVPSKDAYIDFEKNQFVIKSETIGTVVELDKLILSVKDAVKQEKQQWSAEKADVYQKPAVTKENETLKHQKDVWNQCAAVTVHYTFGDQTETLTGMTVKDWMSYDENGNHVEDLVQLKRNIRAYVNTLSEKYNTVGRERMITSTATGQPVKVSGGSYGFLIDTSGECAQLLADIQSHVDTTRVPVYARTAAVYAENDIGNTYVEIDLTAQHLWYYKEGKMIMDSPLVSGTYYNYDRRTPAGTYFLNYKRKNMVLRPAPNPDGTYDYESPVSYWMPFNRGIGMHDANWRWKFGGNIYLYSGSHGCINLPVSFAGGFYESIEPGCPIICFYR